MHLCVWTGLYRRVSKAVFDCLEMFCAENPSAVGGIVMSRLLRVFCRIIINCFYVCYHCFSISSPSFLCDIRAANNSYLSY